MILFIWTTYRFFEKHLSKQVFILFRKQLFF